jgi:hypothetical protein
MAYRITRFLYQLAYPANTGRPTTSRSTPFLPHHASSDFGGEHPAISEPNPFPPHRT